MIERLIKDFKAFIEASGKPQYQVAEEIGLSKFHLNRVINGKTRPSVDLVEKIYEYMYGGDKK